MKAGITGINRKACQEEEATPHGEQAGMMWPQQPKQVFEVVSPRDRQPQLDQKRLQEFFPALLTMEADRIIFRRPASGELVCDAVVGLGLANPIGR
jgi:hypothetical protein